MSAERLGLALRDLAAALDSTGAPWMLIGGLAVVARGVGRTTLDIDLSVSGSGISLPALVAALADRGIVGRVADAETFARQHQILLLRHRASEVPIDLAIAWLPFELEALSAAERIELAGVSTPVETAEDLVISKLVASRPVDLVDAARLLEIHGRTFDLARLRRWVGEFAAALEDAERPKTLERLLAEADPGR